MPRSRLAPVVALLMLVAAVAAPVPALGTASTMAGTPMAGGRSTGTTDAPGRKPLDVTDRWIVVLRQGASVAKASSHARGLGVSPDRTFRNVIRGYSATLNKGQLARLRADPDVAMVVPDAVISLQAQNVPTGVSRVGGVTNPIAAIDGKDTRVDADVAVVDTGIDPSHPDLNVVGGYNCSTSNPDAWQDGNGHGTHVAGTIGALDNGRGVVGVAPGVRLWSVRVLRNDGSGLVSWYVCGLDWLAAQRDPANPDLPLIEAVNMSVARSGSDDHNCGLTNGDVIHQAICRLVAAGVTVVAAAGNNGFNAARMIPASYDEVITVSALADTDGKPGGLGGSLCYSWGSYDRDDTFANFSNYGADIDLIAPGKCIRSTLPGDRYGYLSGTSMAAPHVTGAVALYKASRPAATPAEVRAALRSLGTLNWKTSTDPDSIHEPLLDVSHLVALGDFMLDGKLPAQWIGSAGASLSVPVTVYRAEDVTGDIDLSVVAADPVSATISPTVAAAAGPATATLTLKVPKSTPSGTYRVTVTGADADLARTLTLKMTVDSEPPVAYGPRLKARAGSRFDTTRFTARASWVAAIDAMSSITAYQAQWSVDGGSWGGTINLPASRRYIDRTFRVGHAYALRIRARDAAGNWSSWVTDDPFRVAVSQDRSSTWHRSGTWRRSLSSKWSRGSTLYSRRAGAAIWRTFTGRGISVVAPRSSVRGKAQIWIDGKLERTIDLHRSSLQPRRVVYARAWAESGRHTIRIVVVGTANHPRVDVDALVITR
jgi:subtilisin